MRILFSGFEPFGGMADNPSWEAVRRLPARLEAAEIRRARLPVAFGQAAEALLAEARRLRPEIIIMVGVAQGRQAVTPEKLAINYQDARIPDNAGQSPKARRIDPAGPDGVMTRLSVEAMVDALAAAGLPGKLSLSAGAYVCNDLYYRVLLQEASLGCRCAFIHVPGTEALSEERAARALLVCAGEAIKAAAERPANLSAEV